MLIRGDVPQAYNQLRPHISSKNVRSVDAPIYSFSGDAVWPICVVSVPVRVGEMVAVMVFFVMNIDSPYNIIFGRNWLGEMKAVASPFHQKLKFPSQKGVVVVRGKHEDGRFCFNLAVRGSLSEKKEAEKVEQVNLAEKVEKLIEELKDQPEPWMDFESSCG